MTYIGTSEMLGTVIGALVAAVAAHCRVDPDHVLSYMEIEGEAQRESNPVAADLIVRSCDSARKLIGMQ